MTTQKNDSHVSLIPLPCVPDVPATIQYRAREIVIDRYTTVKELMAQYPHEEDDGVFAVLMNNKVVSLQAAIVRSGKISPINYSTQHGARIYRRHLTMMLYEVFYRIHPECHIQVGQAISEGYYFEIKNVEVTDQLIEELKDGLNLLAAEKVPFEFCKVPVEEARRLFVYGKTNFKRKLLEVWPSAFVGISKLRDFVDFCLGPIAPHTGYFGKFELIRQGTDLILQFPDPGNPQVKRNPGPQPKLYATLKESKGWTKLLGIGHVGDLNAACINRNIREVIKVEEGLHEKKISAIADEIHDTKKRLVLIAGPSSAGKTTFTKRLSIQLKVLGLKPVSISLDNYYVNRVNTPKDENGDLDFEALEAIDIQFLSKQLSQILNGKKVLTPRYNFNTGKRDKKKKWIPIELKSDNVLIMEGIHGLNDGLTPNIAADEKYRIYINALNPLAIDNHNRLHTSDTRLIRRIVRDRHYRGYSAAQTIATWPSVRRGERKHIFPFQESADVIFDSSLIYEFSVLKLFADGYLLEVSRHDPAFAEAYRLRKFLSVFVSILPEDVPQTSLVREFIGGSNFSY